MGLLLMDNRLFVILSWRRLRGKVKIIKLRQSIGKGMTIEEIQKEGVHGEVVPDVVEI